MQDRGASQAKTQPVHSQDWRNVCSSTKCPQYNCSKTGEATAHASPITDKRFSRNQLSCVKQKGSWRLSQPVNSTVRLQELKEQERAQITVVQDATECHQRLHAFGCPGCGSELWKSEGPQDRDGVRGEEFRCTRGGGFRWLRCTDDRGMGGCFWRMR